MEHNESRIVIDDINIATFYRNNPNINIIEINTIFIDILNKLSTNLNETLSNNINHKILDVLTNIGKDISGLKQDISQQLHSTKNEYIENIKLILSNQSLTNNEKTQSIMEKNTDIFITKTSNIINDVIPKHNTLFYSTINESINQLQQSIATDTNKLISTFNKDDKLLNEFVGNLDNKFNYLISNIQQPLFNCIQKNDERTSQNIHIIRDKIVAQQSTQEKLNNELYEFMNKYKHNSSSKGNMSEQQLNSILQSIFPSDEIINCSGETATCDYRVNRYTHDNPNIHQNPNILFENKDYTRSVTTEEVKKFERDLHEQNKNGVYHGIFISQNSNITFKKSFQIDIINNIIHLYLPNANYNADKIKTAVDVIDVLSVTLSQLKKPQSDTVTSININQDDLDEFLELYNEFNVDKKDIIDTIHSNSKKMLEKVEKLQLNSIKKLLRKNGLGVYEEDFSCKFCNAFTGKNKASLGAHMRNCKSNSTL